MANAPPHPPNAPSDRPQPDSRRPGFLARLGMQEDLNFLLTNRIPRRFATKFMGRFSRIRNPLVRSASIALWRRFATDLDFDEAKSRRFETLHDCFIRQLADGARPIDPDPSIVTSPCDALVGAHGRLRGIEAIQAKGYPYSLDELVPDATLLERFRDGSFVTLRIKSSMYHRFHAPVDCRVTRVTYVSGDTWNVNPIALKRIEKLFCKNERAVVELDLDRPDHAILLVPVAAILVAGIKLHCLDDVLDLRYRGAEQLECDARYAKGDEMGYFQHGSTILVFASPGFDLTPDLTLGERIRVGQPLLRFADPA